MKLDVVGVLLRVLCRTRLHSPPLHNDVQPRYEYLAFLDYHVNISPSDISRNVNTAH